MAKNKITNEEVVLRVKNVSKNFHLPHEKTHSIKSSIVNAFEKKDKDVDVQHALRDISFDIKKGEFFGILGRNGSGKSTMLKILAEIYQPTTGFVETIGKLVPFIELGVGFNPELTGRENVYLNGALLGFSRKEVDERYDDIVKFAELEDFMDQKLKNYSSGMQVRLAFSVATHAEADILLVDEVLAVGDADFQRKCYDFFKSLKKSKKTVIFVTHDMGAVREYCDRAILIKDGLVSHEGKAEKIADEYLKLFNESVEDSSSDRDEEEVSRRYGNGLIKFESIKTHLSGDTLTITSTIRNSQDEVDVVVGLRIVNSEGRLITGGNTLMYLKDSQRSKMFFKPNQTKILTYKIPKSIFGSGTYFVGSSIKLKDGVTVCDDWTDSSKFSITTDQSYYPIIAPAELTIDQ